MNTLAKSKLKQLILELKDGLERYSKKGTANQVYIDKQNQQINNLIDIYNLMEQLQYHESWSNIEASIRNTLSQDPNLNGFYVPIRITPMGDNFSLLNCNYLEC